ncbi:sodium/hydrogen exchanger 9B2-like [Anneissia japonica]|uniref:sodium/hydrogen exchanger 9B2-like n=1 Tax=Anneissia japonica TaxID=1529436 RepID=UPI0014258B6F|nr:sodium/hydrogen exchanger 9B2-like [Anneissia japonica]
MAARSATNRQSQNMDSNEISTIQCAENPMFCESSYNGKAENGKQNRCCDNCARSCNTAFRPWMSKYYQPRRNPTLTERLKYSLTCPPHGLVSKLLLYILLLGVGWGVLWVITGDEALPGGNLFGLFILVVFSQLCGSLIQLIKLPELLGMLIVGFLLGNVPAINFAEDIHPEWSSSLRSMALVVILIRAGLGLDAAALRQLSCVCIRLCCMPCVAEATTVAIAANLLLGFPWVWGFMMGFVLGAVTPAVIVPTLLSLQERGFGVSKGIPTLVIAAASCDDVVAISAFGVLLGSAFSTGNLMYNIFRGPLELLIGISVGVLSGILLWYIPDQSQVNFSHKRFILLFCTGLFYVFGSNLAELPGSGALGCLTMAFVAGHGWKQNKEPIERLMEIMWILFQPLLFGLIGAEVKLSYLDPSSIGLGMAVVLIGLTMRILVSILAVSGAGLTNKEKVFVAIAWLPKATVQAAIGSVALDTARERDAGEHLEDLGRQILTIAVLVILITAPIGAILIMLTGPKLLQTNQPLNSIKEFVEVAPEERGLASEDVIRNGEVCGVEEGQMDKTDNYSQTVV